MKDRLYTTFYWGYKPLKEEEVVRMSKIERVFVIDRHSKRDNLEYVMPEEPANQIDGLSNEKTC